MVQKQDILTLYRRDHKSLRAIARELNLNRATVTKVVREFEASQTAEDPSSALDDVLATRPAYIKKKDRPPRVLKDDVVAAIDYWLAENERRRNKGMRKQCLNAKEIHRELLNKDLIVSYSSVCKYIAKVKEESKSPRKTKDVFI